MRFLFLLLWPAFMAAQTATPVQISVNPAKQIATVTPYFNGTNIEDLNNQTNGGIFSQLLHGEAFEESVDVDFLQLPLADYVKVYVVLDEMARPHLLSVANIYTRVNWNNLGEKYDFHSKDIYASVEQASQPRRGRNGESLPPSPSVRLGNLRFWGRFVPFDTLSGPLRDQLLSRLTGNEQISRYWSKLASGNAGGRFLLTRGDAYMGRQTQTIQNTGGKGEWGLCNAGLNKQGIRFVAGMPYEGLLRVKAKTPTTLYFSLRDEKGAVLAEKSVKVQGSDSYQKVTVELTPTADCSKGCFAIALKEPGTVDLGFAFLQPGVWGRVNRYPIRKEFVDALKLQGIKTIRYNGSMVDVGADTYLYRWKKMIGPVDERRVCFRSGFNPYATHSFGIIEMVQFAEVLGARAMVGMSMDETYEDIRDFVEYMNGPVTSEWGELRAKHGHPAPYNLKYIQVDNERPITRGYVECMKKFAQAAWEVDPEMHIMASLNIGTAPQSYVRGGAQYALASELFGWFVAQGQSDKMVWDPHYSGAVGFADHPRFTQEMGIDIQRELAIDYPGHKLTLCPMEENGSRCDWDRGLAHAHNWNTLQRLGNCFAALGTANTFQPHGQHYMWDQGRIHYTSDAMWFQPSAYIDQKMSAHWLPIVLEATSSADSLLDVTAKTNRTADTLSVYVVNLTDTPQAAQLHLADFVARGKSEVWTLGNCPLNTVNTYREQQKIVPKERQIVLKKNGTEYVFPKYSYTIITAIKK